jgi:nucleoside-diphosphate-sugar epimerase
VRMLVTGCAGFIGSHLSERLLEQGHEVVGVDCITDYYDPELKEANLRRLLEHAAFRFHRADLTVADLSPLLRDVEVVFHQAAQPGVRASWGTTFDTYLRNNVLATQRLLEAAKELPLRKLVYASSSSVYGDAESRPTSESALPKPVSPYGVSKLGGEQLAHLYWRNYDVPTVSLRYFTVYGPRQRPDMAFHRFARNALTGRTIEIYGDGEQTRDFTFVDDAVDANIAAAMSDARGVALNIGGGSCVSVNEVLGTLRQIVGRPFEVTYQQVAYGDVRHTSADTRLARELIDYRPSRSLRDGLEAEVGWMDTLLAGGVAAAAASAA